MSGTTTDLALHQSITALSDEIAALRRRGGANIILIDGQRIGQDEKNYLYSFTMEAELILPDDASADLFANDSCYPVVVTAINGLSILLEMSRDTIADGHIETSIPNAKLRTHPWFLLEELRNRLCEYCMAPIEARTLVDAVLRRDDVQTEAIVPIGQDSAGPSNTHLNAQQREAVARVASTTVAFVWGPPGTGKTTTLGEAVGVLVRQGESVLIAAHSNAAVDALAVAIGQVTRTSAAYRAGRILRVGITRSPAMSTHQDMQVREVVRREHPDLMDKIELLEKKREQLANPPRQRPSQPESSSEETQKPIQDQLEDIKKALKVLRKEMRDIEHELIARAQVVACTLSKTAIAEEIYRRRFDAVIVDEASMAYIPADFHLAMLAERRIAFFGDFQQLPPITQANTPAVTAWLEPDVFKKVGIVDRVRMGREDERMTMLTTQHRMHPAIAALIKKRFYANRLITPTEITEQRANLALLPPCPGKATVLLDVGQAHPLAFRENEETLQYGRRFQSHSRFNLVTALLAVEVARMALRHGGGKETVGIITPYAAQARLINRLLKDAELPSKQITCATVHRFQGSERDIIIFDIVESGPLPRAGRLVASTDGDLVGRLLNVALSRARGKLIVLANLAYLRQVLPPDHVYLDILGLMTTNGKGHPVAPSKTPGTGISAQRPLPHISYFPREPNTANTIPTQLGQDLHEAGILALALPPAISTTNKSVLSLISAVADVGVPSSAQIFIKGPAERVFKIVAGQQHWAERGLAWPVIGIDQRILWIENTHYILRIDNEAVVKLLYGLWGLLPENMRRIKSAAQRAERARQGESFLGRKCPRCDSELWLSDQNRFGPELICARGCGYHTALTPDFATQWALIAGVACRECGGSLAGVRGTSGVYLRCQAKGCRGWLRMRDIV